MNVVFYSIGVAEPITPNEPLPPPPAIPRGSLVVIEGRAPIWRYGRAIHALHGTAAAAVAVFDPRLGAVVVATHSPNFREGEIFELDLPSTTENVASNPQPSNDGTEKRDVAPSSVSAFGESQERGSSRSVVAANESPLSERILDWLEPFRFSPLRLVFRFSRDVAFDVSRLRGVWGKALKELDETLYIKVFQGGEDSSRRTPRYIVRPSNVVGIKANENDSYCEAIDFVSWGTTVKERETLIQAWNVAAKTGIGKKRSPFELKAIEPLENLANAPISVAAVARARRIERNVPWRLRFLTPIRLLPVRGGKKRLLDAPTLPDLISAAVSRLTELRLQTATAEELASSRPFPTEEAIALARTVAATPWRGERVATRRYSGSQRQEIDLFGTIGYLTLPQGPGDLESLLTASEQIHLGKSTAFGLGRLSIETDDE